jgi:hypothetical protein
MFTNALRVAPALMLALLVCGCAGSPIDNEKRARLDYGAAYSSCKSANKTDMRACDMVMETDVRSNNSSGYVEVGLNSGTTSRRTVNSR